MGAPLKLKTFDKVVVTLEGRTVEAEVILASADGKSLALGFDAMLGGYVAMMPVQWIDGAYRDLVAGRPVVIVERNKKPGGK